MWICVKEITVNNDTEESQHNILPNLSVIVSVDPYETENRHESTKIAKNFTVFCSLRLKYHEFLNLNTVSM